MTKTLTVNSTPEGIPVQITTPDKAYWIITNTTVDLEDGITVYLKAVNSYYSSGTGYGFTSWKLDSGTPSSDPLLEITMNANHTAEATYTAIGYYPVRNPSRRHTKYEKKTDEEVAQIRTIALKPMMVDQVQTTAPEQDRLEATVARILHPKGLSGIMIHHYRNFSQELYGLKRKFTDESLNTEASIIARKWKDRGLNEDILKEIATALGITITLT